LVVGAAVIVVPLQETLVDQAVEDLVVVQINQVALVLAVKATLEVKVLGLAVAARVLTETEVAVAVNLLQEHMDKTVQTVHKVAKVLAKT
jgi:uncharacterized membrane protein